MYADKNRTGFLAREDFYNSLKLVTVAQSGRELTPDIVKSALYGPAATKIPAPRINISTAGPQTGAVASPANATQTQPSGQPNPAMKGSQGLPAATPNSQVLQPGNVVRPPQPPSTSTTPAQGRPPVGGGPTGLNQTSSTTPNLSTDWFGGKKNASPLGVTSQAPPRGISPTPVAGYGSHTQPPVTPVNVNLTDRNMLSSQTSPSVTESKALVPLGNGLPSNSTFGADPFSATSQAKQDPPLPSVVSNTFPSSTAPGSAAASFHPPKPVQSGPMQGISSLPSQTGQLLQSQPGPRQHQFNAVPSSPGTVSANDPGGQIPSNSNQSQAPWPKITQADVRKYMIVFIKVDRDRDGKITGEEARNLFLSWRLPRGIHMFLLHLLLPFVDAVIQDLCGLQLCIFLFAGDSIYTVPAISANNRNHRSSLFFKVSKRICLSTCRHIKEGLGSVGPG
jgi:epidermal growth factor receptor substrate 15